MATDERLVCVDIETAGLNPVVHPIIQIAAIAVDSRLNELETFEAKIRFDENQADSQSLKGNRYSKDEWQTTAARPIDVANRFSRFLRRHATVDRLSESSGWYRVAQLVAHNGERFDGPFIHAWYRRLGLFCPAAYMVLCTKQRALWLFEENKTLTPPTDFKLGTLCEYFGVSLSASEAHDALNDVRATVALYREMHRYEGGRRNGSKAA